MGYADLSSAFAYKEPLFATKLDALGENDKFLKDNGWQDGTKLLFYSATVPTGWTLDATDDNYFLRVVSGIGGGVGGSKDPTTGLPTTHTHTLTTEADHTHDLSPHGHNLDGDVSSETNFVGSTTYMLRPGNQTMQQAGGAGPLPRDFPGPLVRGTTSVSGGTTTASGTHNHSGLDSQSPSSSVIFRYTDIIIGTKDTSVGYTDLTNEFDHNDKANFDPFEDLEDNDNFLNDRIMPFGSVSVFFQSGAPSGWTQTTPENDRLLRLVSGAGLGTGGNQSPTSAVNFSHTHGESVAHPSHNHDISSHTHVFNERTITNGNDARVPNRYTYVSGSRIKLGDGTAVTRNATKGQVVNGSATSGNSAGTAHSIQSALGSIQIAYIDIITASKNSGGAPFPYVDLAGENVYKKLISKQRLNAFGKNDEYLNFHTMESGAKTLFTNPTAPLTWTQDVSQNGKALRVVSGSGGGSAGTQDPGAAWDLDHLHVLFNSAHSHSANHVHDIDEVSQANVGNAQSGGWGDSDLGTIVSGSRTNDLDVISTTAAFSSNVRRYKPTTEDVIFSLTTPLHTHTAGNSNPTFTFKYKNTILCTKD